MSGKRGLKHVTYQSQIFSSLNINYLLEIRNKDKNVVFDICKILIKITEKYIEFLILKTGQNAF